MTARPPGPHTLKPSGCSTRGSRRRNGSPGRAPTAVRPRSFSCAGQWARAAEELHAWQREFPAAKLDGYLTLLGARYWAGRQKPEQAISLAEQLIAVSPASPYADQLLMLAADCETACGRPDRAAATLHSLIKDYPGSPLIPAAKEKLEGGSRFRVWGLGFGGRSGEVD